MAYEIAPLNWEAPSSRTNGCYVAKTIIGTYSVVNEDGWYACKEDGPEFWEFSFEDPEEIHSLNPYPIMEKCREHYEQTIKSALNEVTI